ncbi:unnamed protein product [Rhodiola kirilowii]
MMMQTTHRRTKFTVGDFGLARCQADGELAEETRVMGSYSHMGTWLQNTPRLD